MKKLSNISVKEFREVLSRLGLHLLRTTGGHEIWTKTCLKRAIVFQTHVEPIPEFIVRNAIRDLGMSREEFIAVLEEK